MPLEVLFPFILLPIFFLYSSQWCSGFCLQIRETPNKKHHKFIEFYDVRAAEAALRSLNKSEIAGKRIKLEPSRPGGTRRKYDFELLFHLFICLFSYCPYFWIILFFLELSIVLIFCVSWNHILVMILWRFTITSDNFMTQVSCSIYLSNSFSIWQFLQFFPLSHFYTEWYIL